MGEIRSTFTGSPNFIEHLLHTARTTEETGGVYGFAGVREKAHIQVQNWKSFKEDVPWESDPGIWR